MVRFGTASLALIARDGRVGVRVRDREAATRTRFLGLDSFPVDPTWRVAAAWMPAAVPRTLAIPTTLGTARAQPVRGTAVFVRDGRRHALVAVGERADRPAFVFADREYGVWMITRKPYPSDLCASQWQHIAPLIPPAKPGGRPRTADVRECLNAIFSVTRAGSDWRMLPHDLPPWGTAYSYFRRWQDDAGALWAGWEMIHDTLRERVRVAAGRARKKGAARVRRGEEGQRAQAAHPRRHAGAAARGRRPHGEYQRP